MSDATISVVIPSFNSARWLPETLASVLGQSGVQLEVIVVDDGSTDNTAEIVEGFPEVRYLPQRNSGAAAARNTGIRAARGNYVALLDADDIWESRKLRAQAELLDRHSGVGLIFTDYSPFGVPVDYQTGFARSRVLAHIPRRQIGHKSYVLESQNLFLDVLKDLFPWTSSLLIRKNLLEQIGPLPEAIRSGQDWLMCLKLAKICDFAFVDECLVHRREHEGSLSRTGHLEQKLAVVLEHILEWSALSPTERAAAHRMLAQMLFGSGYFQLRRGELQAARSSITRYLAVRRSLAPNVATGLPVGKALAYWAATWLPTPLIKAISQLRQSAAP